MNKCGCCEIEFILEKEIINVEPKYNPETKKYETWIKLNPLREVKVKIPSSKQRGTNNV